MSRAYCIFFTAILLAFPTARGDEQSYVPLDISANWKAETLAMAVKDLARNREIPLRVYLPAIKTPAPVVLFSHR